MAKKVEDILKEKHWLSKPLHTIPEQQEGIRLNIVTDDIGKRSLFGGVATALVFASMLCAKNDWTLRIITRTTACNLNDYYNFLEIYGIEVPRLVEAYSDENSATNVFNYKLPISKQDVFLATSWWSAKSILESNICNRILYIIQEEETFFYPYSDERFWCEEIMHSDQIDYIVNSKLLYDYLKINKYNTLINNALYFEPAFSEKLYFPSESSFEKKKNEKRKLFFYGRPKNPRNLFYFGLECLDEAVTRGVIDTDLWDIYFAGYDIEKIQFTNGYEPKMMGTMSWKEYAEFARTIDVAFCLMYTPHPSYPPFDMLCSGAVVLTNEFKNKKDLSYSKNMILAKLEKDAILKGFAEAIELASDTEKRKENYENNNINQTWEESFKDIIPIVEERILNQKYV